MLPCNLRTWTRGQILLAMFSILATVDASTVSSTASSRTTRNVAVHSTTSAPDLRGTYVPGTHLTGTHLPGNSSPSVTVQSSSLIPSSAASSVLTGPTAHSVTVSGQISTTLIQTIEPNNKSSSQTQVPQETFTTVTFKATDSRDLTSLENENITMSKTEPTTPIVQSPDSVTTQQSTTVMNDSQTTAPGSITCLGLGSFKSTSQVVCFQYEEETTCETLDDEKKEKLRSFLCEIMNTTQCNVTIHSSEVQPQCILWIPTSRGAEVSLQGFTHTANNPVPMEIKWGQISDHQTRSQKTMIALVTCGVLLAALILAGYFFSNRESWSPGRQRLGEDPYCTETDSQGNTLVSVSAHAQDKPNSGTRENGTGQTVAATNGHSTKKQTVSDTEL